MIYQMKLVIRDEERDITDFIYHCHISHYNDPDLDKMIELHIKVCEEIGNREDLPIEGDLIALTFNSTNHDQFFYDWLFEGAMHDGEIQFIYNEVETADIFRFWDCYCLGLEESMSVGGAPMRITTYLSPGIIKRNNLEAREKVWKVSSPSTEKKATDTDNTQEVPKKTSKENVTFVSNGKGSQISDADEAIIAAQMKQSSQTFQQEKAKFKKLGIPPNPAATNKQKGNFGEIAACNNLLTNSKLKKGSNGKQYNLKRIGEPAPANLDSKIVKGIDGIYENVTPLPKFIIDEAKFGTSMINPHTGNGRQMSNGWITGSKRIEKQFPQTPDGIRMAAKLRNAIINGEVEMILSKVDDQGNVTNIELDKNGKEVGPWP